MTIRSRLESHALFDGTQEVVDHGSLACACDMRVAVFIPPQAAQGPVPVVWWLSGLTCTPMNFTEKAGAQRIAAELGLMLVAPDTSPRGEGVADDDAYDLGQGAGFYVDATRDPWAAHYKMFTYVATELPSLIAAEYPADMTRQAIFGHSMGGHGALVQHLRHPGRFRAVSAFAPIVAPSAVPWGEKAFSAYLGDERAAWAAYDASALVAEAPSQAEILIDQGEADGFLAEQLQPERFVRAAQAAGQPVVLRRHAGYDHSYYFIATFIEDHLRRFAAALTD
jgi:S-formylglutathione hydrolase